MISTRKLMLLLAASVAGLACPGLVAGATPKVPSSGSAALNRIVRLDLSVGSRGALVVLKGTRAPRFTHFQLVAPPRLVVDLRDSDLSAVPGGHRLARGPVAGVGVSQFTSDQASIGRLVLQLRRRAAVKIQTSQSPWAGVQSRR